MKVEYNALTYMYSERVQNLLRDDLGSQAMGRPEPKPWTWSPCLVSGPACAGRNPAQGPI